MSRKLKNTIIILTIKKKNYLFIWLSTHWETIEEIQHCPACKSNGMSRHGSYCKYYYDEELPILRLRCGRCKITHAIMPSFSLPGTSIGTGEAEEYLISRAEGKSRRESSTCFEDCGLAEIYPKQLERMFSKAIFRAKALFPHHGEVKLSGIDWIESVCKTRNQPLYCLNKFSLEQGVNSVCFNRCTILIFREKNVSSGSSHNRVSSGLEVELLDSS